MFENNLTQLFTKGFLAVLTSKDAVLKEVRDCILQDDPQRCKEVNPYLFSYWRDLHVRSGCVCVDERVAIPHAIQDAVLESLHLTHPGSWGMITLGQYAFWPYMHREILNKAATCKPCTDIGKNLKPVIPASKWKPLLPCTEPNEEIQIDFGGPITNEKDQDNQEYPKLVFAIAILLNSVLAPNGTSIYGNTRNVDPYHTKKQRKKKLHSTRRI